jgi:hypothetical protein
MVATSLFRRKKMLFLLFSRKKIILGGLLARVYGATYNLFSCKLGIIGKRKISFIRKFLFLLYCTRRRWGEEEGGGKENRRRKRRQKTAGGEEGGGKGEEAVRSRRRTGTYLRMVS